MRMGWGLFRASALSAMLRSAVVAKTQNKGERETASDVPEHRRGLLLCL